MRATLWCSLLLVAGCYQVHHPTHVREGTRFEFAGGVARVTPRLRDPAPDEPSKQRTGADGFLGIGMGKRYGSTGFMFHGTIPLTTFYFDSNPRQTWSGPSFTLFVQDDTEDDQLSFGIGTILGLRAALYTQVGFRPWPSAKNGLSIDVGGRIDTASIAAPYGSITMQLGNVEVGTWIDTSFYLAEPALYTDDPTDADYSERRVTAGLLVRAFTR